MTIKYEYIKMVIHAGRRNKITVSVQSASNFSGMGSPEAKDDKPENP